MNKTPEQKLLNTAFLLLLGATSFWLICVMVSQHLGKPPKATHEKPSVNSAATRGNTSPEDVAANSVPGPPPLPEFLKPLETKVIENPRSVVALNEYADALMAEGLKNADPALLMRSVQSYSKVLAIEPANPKALLGMASVSFESGVFDKARDYYRKYLDVVPNDLKAKTDYSLSLIQSGESKKAEEVLKEILTNDPKIFSAQLSLALAQKVSGDKTAAKASAEAALELSPDEKGQVVVKQFLANLNSPEAITTAEEVSPAIAVDSYFRKHQILGPKVEKISWASDSIVEVTLREFPIEQMPEFAKDRLKKSLGELAQRLHLDLTVKFIAAEDKRVIFSEDFKGKVL